MNYFNMPDQRYPSIGISDVTLVKQNLNDTETLLKIQEVMKDCDETHVKCIRSSMRPLSQLAS